MIFFLQFDSSKKEKMAEERIGFFPTAEELKDAREKIYDLLMNMTFEEVPFPPETPKEYIQYKKDEAFVFFASSFNFVQELELHKFSPGGGIGDPYTKEEQTEFNQQILKARSRYLKFNAQPIPLDQHLKHVIAERVAFILAGRYTFSRPAGDATIEPIAFEGKKFHIMTTNKARRILNKIPTRTLVKIFMVYTLQLNIPLENLGMLDFESFSNLQRARQILRGSSKYRTAIRRMVNYLYGVATYHAFAEHPSIVCTFEYKNRIYYHLSIPQAVERRETGGFIYHGVEQVEDFIYAYPMAHCRVLVREWGEVHFIGRQRMFFANGQTNSIEQVSDAVTNIIPYSNAASAGFVRFRDLKLKSDWTPLVTIRFRDFLGLSASTEYSHPFLTTVDWVRWHAHANEEFAHIIKMALIRNLQFYPLSFRLVKSSISGYLMYKYEGAFKRTVEDISNLPYDEEMESDNEEEASLAFESDDDESTFILDIHLSDSE